MKAKSIRPSNSKPTKTSQKQGLKIRPKSKGDFKTSIKEGLNSITQQVDHLFHSQPRDLVAAIKMDHDSLRNFLKTLKDTDKKLDQRKKAYKQFAALLKSHSHSEEETAYRASSELPGREMHIKTAEGYVEHHVADDLMARMEKTKYPLTWSAHANVLAESVEHHLDEEEKDLLPLLRKNTDARLDEMLLTQYLKLRTKSQKKVGPQNAGVLKRSQKK